MSDVLNWISLILIIALLETGAPTVPYTVPYGPVTHHANRTSAVLDLRWNSLLLALAQLSPTIQRLKDAHTNSCIHGIFQESTTTKRTIQPQPQPVYMSEPQQQRQQQQQQQQQHWTPATPIIIDSPPLEAESYISGDGSDQPQQLQHQQHKEQVMAATMSKDSTKKDNTRELSVPRPIKFISYYSPDSTQGTSGNRTRQAKATTATTPSNETSETSATTTTITSSRHNSNHNNNTSKHQTTITTTTAMMRRSSPSIRKTKKNKIRIPLSEMIRYFAMPQHIAAKKLNVSVSTLKRRFYELCIHRWPSHYMIHDHHQYTVNLAALNSLFYRCGTGAKVIQSSSATIRSNSPHYLASGSEPEVCEKGDVGTILNLFDTEDEKFIDPMTSCILAHAFAQHCGGHSATRSSEESSSVRDHSKDHNNSHYMDQNTPNKVRDKE